MFTVLSLLSFSWRTFRDLAKGSNIVLSKSIILLPLNHKPTKFLRGFRSLLTWKLRNLHCWRFNPVKFVRFRNNDSNFTFGENLHFFNIKCFKFGKCLKLSFCVNFMLVSAKRRCGKDFDQNDVGFSVKIKLCSKFNISKCFKAIKHIPPMDRMSLLFNKSTRIDSKWSKFVLTRTLMLFLDKFNISNEGIIELWLTSNLGKMNCLFRLKLKFLI